MGFFFLCRLLKILRQHFKLDCLHLKFRIVQVQFSNLRIIEPVAHALTVQVHDFGIDVIHVNTFCRGLVYVQHLERQKRLLPVGSVRNSLPFTEAMKLARWGYSSM